MNEITGGNVTIIQLNLANKQSDPNSIVTLVQYPNESTSKPKINIKCLNCSNYAFIVNLDDLPMITYHLIKKGNDKIEREIEIVTKKTVPDFSENNHDLIMAREIRTSQLGNLDLFVWIMLFLIFFLLIVLIYLLFLLCKDKR